MIKWFICFLKVEEGMAFDIPGKLKINACGMIGGKRKTNDGITYFGTEEFYNGDVIY
jgi:hypothetical protein